MISMVKNKNLELGGGGCDKVSRPEGGYGGEMFKKAKW